MTCRRPSYHVKHLVEDGERRRWSRTRGQEYVQQIGRCTLDVRTNVAPVDCRQLLDNVHGRCKRQLGLDIRNSHHDDIARSSE